MEFHLEAHRVLKPGGKIFINVPFVNFEHEILYDFNRPTRFALSNWLNDAGFNKISVNPTSSNTETICSYFPIALFDDILRTDNSSEFIAQIRRSKFGLKKIGNYFQLFFAVLVYFLAKFFCYFIRLIVDRGSYQKALFPVGWIAVATKEGKLNKKPFYKTREDFLKHNRLKS